jgi:hypothetical protein
MAVGNKMAWVLPWAFCLAAISCVEPPAPWVPLADGSGLVEIMDRRAGLEIVASELLLDEAAGETDSTPLACEPACVGAPCGDGDGCGGFCYDLLSCDDGVDCTIDLCLTEGGGGCVHVADHALCEADGQCGTPLCEEGVGCTVVFVEGACSDGDLCTVDDICLNGTCTGEPLNETACADDNLCTKDVCQPDKGCLHSSADGDCVAGIEALPGECQLGICVPQAVLQAPCAETGDCALFNSGDLCNGTLLCGDDGFCQLDLESLPQCDDSLDTPCQKNRCDPETGECAMQPEGDGLPCEDGDSCTLGDSCVGGLCGEGGNVVGCDDLNTCTADLCLAESGCSHTPLDGSCSDGNLCTSGDVCVAGICSGSPYGCGDGLDCTADICVGDGNCEPPTLLAGWCLVDGECIEDGTHDPENWCRHCDAASETVSLSDVLFGTECFLPGAAGKCIAGECKNIECLLGFLSCDGSLGNGCEVDGSSDPLHCGGCGESCSPGEVCLSGECLPSCPDTGNVPCGAICPDHETDPMHCGDCDVVCKVTDPGKVGSCVDSECLPVTCPEDLWDFDGIPNNGCEYECQTSGEEICDGKDNDCDGFLDEESCDDGVDCTIDSCNVQLGCQYTPATQLCDDGNPCTEGSCDPVEGCSFAAIIGPCEDGNPCTADDQCQGIDCIGEVVEDCCLAAEDCDDGNPCTFDGCEADSNTCAYLAGPMDLEPCDLDSDGCTQDQCLDGICTAGPEVECPEPGVACLVALCLPQGPFEYACDFEPLPEGEPCDDGSYCLIGEVCDAQGDCGGSQERDCGQSLGNCLDVWCDEEQDQCSGVPKEDGTSCDADANGCTLNDECQQGLCFPGPAPECPGDPAACLAGLCASNGPTEYECQTGPAAPGTSCDDGLPCTVEETCDFMGECGSGKEKICEPPGIACVESNCDVQSGDCVLGASAPGTACDDENPCTMTDSCQGGQCVGEEDGCADRQLNATSKLVFHSPRPEQQQMHHLGFGRSVTVWRAGSGDLRGQLLDKEGTKLLPDLPLTTAQWPPEPANCGREVTRPAVAVRANGDWLVTAGYGWRSMHYTGCKEAWYKRLCNFNIYYGLGYAIYDRHGTMKQDWLPILTDRHLWGYSTSYYGCNCSCSTGGHMPALTALAQDHVSAMAFSDGSFGILSQVDGGAAEFRPVTASLELGGAVSLGAMSRPHGSALSGDQMVVVWEQSGQAYFRLYDKAGDALGEAVPVSDQEVGHQERARCRALDDSGFVVVFNTAYGGGPGDMFFRRFDGSGVAQGNAVKVNQATDGVQFAADAPAPLEGGGFVAVWHDDESGGKGYTVKGRQYQADLTPSSSEFELGGEAVGGHQLVVAESIGEDWLASWSNPTQGASRDLVVRRFDEAGKPSPGALERRVMMASGEDQGAGVASQIPGGGFAVAWKYEDGGPQDTDIALRTFAIGGAGVGEPQAANQYGAGLQYGVAMVRESLSKRLLVAWTSMGQFEGEDVVARLFDDSGVPVGDEFRINDEVAGGQFDVSLASAEINSIAAGWAGDSGTDAGTDVYLRLFDGDGEAITGDLPVAEDNSGEQGQLVLISAAELDGAALAAAWSTSASGESGGVFARLFEPTGEPLLGAIHVATGPSYDQLGMAGQAGHYLVCWRAGTSLACRRLGPGLAPIGEAFVVESEGNPTQPLLLFRDVAEAWVVYSRDGVDREGDGIYRRHVDLGGEAKSPAALLNWGEAGDQRVPFGAVLSTGEVVAGWTGVGDQGRELFFRILD